jgi:uncharacterized DUF497 family protein
MSSLRFGWDSRKSLANEKKHGVSFEEAKTVFLDENARFMPDPEHSKDEDRFVIMGISSRLRLLVVCHCYRETTDIIRIISARKATSFEASFYSLD